MSQLWKPEKHDKSAINCGNSKERIGRMKLEGALILVDCKYCGREIYLNPSRHGMRMLTKMGSEHACKDSPRGKYLKAKATRG